MSRGIVRFVGFKKIDLSAREIRKSPVLTHKSQFIFAIPEGLAAQRGNERKKTQDTDWCPVFF